MSFFNWVIGDGVAKYLGRLATGKNSLEGLIVTTVAEATTTTFDAAALIGGFILYDPLGGTANATTPTAAEIVAALGDAAVKGAVFKWYLRHNGSTSEVVTLVAGTGVTLSPTTIALDGNEIIPMLVRLDIVESGSEEVTIYSLGLNLMST